MILLGVKVVKLRRIRHQQDSLASFLLIWEECHSMAAPLCLSRKTNLGVQPKLMQKEHTFRDFGVIAMKPVHLMSSEQVNTLLLYSKIIICRLVDSKKLFFCQTVHHFLIPPLKNKGFFKMRVIRSLKVRDSEKVLRGQTIWKDSGTK
jgi:hypothetical protein